MRPANAQKKAAEEALRESEELFRATFENAAVGMAHVSADGRFFRVNRRLCEILGYRASELCAKTVKEISHPADVEASTPRLQQMASGSIDSFTLEKRYLRKDQTTVWVKITIGCMRRADKTVDYHISVVEDISERKAAETALRESEQRFRALAQVSVNALYRMSADASVMLEGNGQGFMKDMPHATQSWLATYIPPHEQATVLKAARQAVATLTPLDLEHRAYLADGTIGWIRNRAVPILEESGAVREWFGSATNITEQKRAELALRQNEERLQLALEAGGIGTWFWEIGGQVFHDARCKALHGVAPDGTLGPEIWKELVHPEDWIKIDQAVARALDPADPHDHYHCEYRVRHPDGKELIVAATGCAFFQSDSGLPSKRRPVSMAGTARDITELRRVEALRESEARLRQLSDSLPGSAVYQFIVDPDRTAHWGYVSAGIEQLIGVRLEELLQDARAIEGQVLPEYRNVLIEAEKKSAHNLSDFLVEAPVRRPDGEVRWLRFQSRPRSMPNGSIMWEGIATDVTERKQAEEALRESEERLRLANEAAGISSITIDAGTGVAFYSPELSLMLGHSGSGQAGIKNIFERVHREDVARVRDRFESSLRGEKNGRLKIDFRYVRPGGEVVWLTWAGRVQFRETQAGRVPSRVIGAVMDITERKRAEKAVLEAAERLRLSIEAGRIGTFTVDIETAYAQYSAETAAMLGYHDARGGEMEIFFSGVHADDSARVRAEYDAALGGKGVVKSDFRFVRHDGQVCWIELTGRVEFRETAGGKVPVRFLGACVDHTERKLQEEQIRLLMSEVNHRSKNMLTLVYAIARQTLSANPEDFLDRFGDRIEALAASQDLLVKNEWRGVDLDGLVRSQLAHFKDLIGTRIEMGGPFVFVSAAAAQPLGMALHELATNAGKYGAFSTNAGRVEIKWSLEGAGAAREFAMSWCEQGGPPVTAPSRQGFGATVTGFVIESSLNGKVELSFPATGVVWKLRCPSSEVLEGSPQRNH